MIDLAVLAGIFLASAWLEIVVRTRVFRRWRRLLLPEPRSWGALGAAPSDPRESQRTEGFETLWSLEKSLPLCLLVCIPNHEKKMNFFQYGKYVACK